MTNEQIAEKAALELSDWVSHNGVDFGWFKRCFLAAIVEATNNDAEITRLKGKFLELETKIDNLQHPGQPVTGEPNLCKEDWENH